MRWWVSLFPLVAFQGPLCRPFQKGVRTGKTLRLPRASVIQISPNGFIVEHLCTTFGKNTVMNKLLSNPFLRPARLRWLLLSALLSASASTFAQGNTAASRFYEDALQRYEKRDYAGSVIQLKNALKENPNNLPVQLLLGKALLENGDVVGAEVAFTEALRLGVNRAEVVERLGQSMVAQGKQLDMLAHPALQPAGLPSGLQVQMLLLRGSAQADLGQIAPALQSIDEARRLDSRSPDVWLAEVPIRIRSKNFVEAMQAVERALGLAPSMAEAHYQKGSILHVQGELPGAMASYARALQLDANHAEALIARIGLHLDANRMDDATRDVATLQRISPKEPRGSYFKALLAERKGQVPQAQAALREVTSLLDPVPMSFMRYRQQLLMLNGLAHHGLNEPEKARQYLEAFLRTQPNSPVTRLLARIYLSTGKVSEAANLLENYLKTQPGDGLASNLLGSVYIAQGKHARAANLMQQTLKSQDLPEYRATLGMSLLGSGQTASALTELEAAYKKDPKQLPAAIVLSQLYLREGQPARGLALIQALVKQQPANASLHNLLGMAQAQNGDSRAARASFEKATQLSPGLTQAQLNLVRLDLDARALDTAEKRLSILLKTDPRNTGALADMARVADLRGKPTEALTWLEKARDNSGPRELRWNLALVDLHLRAGRPEQALAEAKIAQGKSPDNITGLLLYSRVQLAMGNAQGARGSLSRATRLADFDADLQVEIASQQLAAQNPDGAYYSLDKALTGQPDSLPAQVLMARVEMQRGEVAKAEQRARNIVQKHPRRAVGHTLTGDLASAQNRPGPALEAFRKAHAVEPSSGSTLRLMQTLEIQGNDKGALEAASQRLRQAPQDTLVLASLANLHARAGRYAEAGKTYQTLLAQQPQDVGALNNLANVQLKLGDKTALQTAEKAHTLAPANALVIDTLGWAHHHFGEQDKALSLLRDARLREPSNPEIRYHLAKVLAQSGRPAEAREELREAMKTGRPFEGSQDAEQLLKTLN